MKPTKLSVLILTSFAIVSTIVFAGRISAFAEEKYGEEAYEYIRYIDSEFPSRVGNTTANEAMRQYLTDTVASFGYTPVLKHCEGTEPNTGIFYNGVNIEFDKPGKSDRIILISAHYDSIDTNGCEDNATGVGVLLETAKRIYDTETPYTIRFVLFDIEEECLLGSTWYVLHEDLSRIELNINLDSIGSGQYLYSFGGVYQDEKLIRDLPFWQMNEIASARKLDLHNLPSGFYEDNNLRYPVKTSGSDHVSFSNMQIPYIYLSATYWDLSPASHNIAMLDPAVPGGVVIHKPEFDNFEFLDANCSERIRSNLAICAELLDYSVQYMDFDTDSVLASVPEKEEQEEPTESMEETESKTEPEEATTADNKSEPESVSEEAVSEEAVSSADRNENDSNNSQPASSSKGLGIPLIVLVAVFFAVLIPTLGIGFYILSKKRKLS